MVPLQLIQTDGFMELAQALQAYQIVQFMLKVIVALGQQTLFQTQKSMCQTIYQVITNLYQLIL